MTRFCTELKEAARETSAPVHITKEFTIHEVSAAKVSNVPFRITLEGHPFRETKESSLMFNEAICAHYKIPMSLDLVGRTLICVFESCERPQKDKAPKRRTAPEESLQNDQLVIRSLKKTESMSPSCESLWKDPEVSRVLKLCSPGGGDGIHLHPISCPFYQFILELSEEEYAACKALPPNSVFKVSFRLA